MPWANNTYWTVWFRVSHNSSTSTPCLSSWALVRRSWRKKSIWSWSSSTWWKDFPTTSLMPPLTSQSVSSSTFMNSSRRTLMNWWGIRSTLKSETPSIYIQHSFSSLSNATPLNTSMSMKFWRMPHFSASTMKWTSMKIARSTSVSSWFIPWKPSPMSSLPWMNIPILWDTSNSREGGKLPSKSSRLLEKAVSICLMWMLSLSCSPSSAQSWRERKTMKIFLKTYSRMSKPTWQGLSGRSNQKILESSGRFWRSSLIDSTKEERKGWNIPFLPLYLGYLLLPIPFIALTPPSSLNPSRRSLIFQGNSLRDSHQSNQLSPSNCTCSFCSPSTTLTRVSSMMSSPMRHPLNAYYSMKVKYRILFRSKSYWNQSSTHVSDSIAFLMKTMTSFCQTLPHIVPKFSRKMSSARSFSAAASCSPTHK